MTALLIGLPGVPDPAGRVALLRIVMRPVNHAAFRVPFVFAVKSHCVPVRNVSMRGARSMLCDTSSVRPDSSRTMKR